MYKSSLFLLLLVVLTGYIQPISVDAQIPSSIELQKVHEWEFNDFELLANPMEASVLTDTTLVVFDRGRLSINHFSKEGQLLSTAGRSGRGPMEFLSIANIVINNTGYVAVADLGNARILIYNVYTEQYRTVDFLPGWGTQLQWVGSKLVITNSPLAGNVRDQARLVMQYYDMDTEELNEFYELPVMMEAQSDSDLLTCLFCFVHFDQRLRMYVSPPDTSYRVYRVDPEKEEPFLFSHSSQSNLKYTPEEKREMEERIQQANAQVGIQREFRAPEYRRRIFKSFVDHKDRVWVLMNPTQGESSFLDIFDESGNYLQRVDSTMGNNILQFSDGWILYMHSAGETYRVSLYKIVL